ncbi:START domain-containing protein [Schistosoma japonicum]|uniref:SJCHGC05756 protein n=1 Tax=Schistosoma japonicum TaxID=6182 RepID=Q5DEY0_SCHJA|nr:SJCHGC05756 protein [Schistosoma japonicum]TNN16733.1 START domain-containing protein [Schistosoma japonicum]
MSLPVIGEVASDTAFLLKVVEEYLSGSPWTQEYAKNDVRVWSKGSENEGIKCFKATALFKGVSGSELFDCIMDSEYRKQWDKSMIESYEFCQVNPKSDIGYYSLRSPPGLKNRDFVLQRTWEKFDAYYVIACHSVFHKAVPVRKQFIRALSHINAYIIRVLSTHSCEMTYVTNCDPRGKIPIWVINKATQFMAPRAIQILYKASTKYNTWKKSNHPDRKPWLYPEQINLPILCWGDLETTTNLGPTDDGESGNCESTPLPDESISLDRNDSFNSQEEVEAVTVFNSASIVDDQLQSCVTATSLTTALDSG